MARPAVLLPSAGDQARTAPVVLFGLAIAAFSLRTAMGSVPPLLEDLQRSLGLSSAAAGVLVSLPILGLGLGAPFGPALARAMGDMRGLAACMTVIAAGCLLRALPFALALFAGTILAAAATGVAGVLVPAIAKRLAPGRVGALTGAYTLLLVAGTATASGLDVPIARAFGGHLAVPLAVWALPALVAVSLLARGRRSEAAPEHGRSVTSLGGAWIWRDPVAREVTGFLTLETVLFYSLFSWLPSVARAEGTSAGTAAAALSLFSLVGMPMSLLVPMLADRRPRQGSMAALLSCVSVAGLAGLLLASEHSLLLWAAVLGVAQGGAFGLALALLALRAPDGSSAAELAGMAQTTAYLVGAAAALALGLLHDLSGGWGPSLALLMLVGIGQLALGMAAGRDRLVDPPLLHALGGASRNGSDPAPRTR